MIYLDNNATTQPAPEVVAAMLPYLTELYGNPSSQHRLGARAERALAGSDDSMSSRPVHHATARVGEGA